MFVEISLELAAERQIEHGGWIVVSTPRGEIEARAMVMRRVRSLQVQGRLLHHIGIPIHWGYAGEIVGDCANDLTSLITESNVSMHGAKAFACQVRAGRLHLRNQRGEVPFVALPVNEPVPDTPESTQPEGRQGTDRNGR
jgi:formate dehydrogenase major subunit